MHHWNILDRLDQLNEIEDNSFKKPQIIFKHSTTCPISKIAKLRFESDWEELIDADLHYLDLLSFRPISNGIAEHFSVRHESPQILVISDGRCIFHSSHLDIHAKEVMQSLKATS